MLNEAQNIVSGGFFVPYTASFELRQETQPVDRNQCSSACRLQWIALSKIILSSSGIASSCSSRRMPAVLAGSRYSCHDRPGASYKCPQSIKAPNGDDGVALARQSALSGDGL
jgi:hypothetical protein